MTTFSNNNIAEAIYLASKDAKEEKQFLHKVIQFLVKKRLLSKVPDILLALSKIINDHNKVVVAKVSSVNKINETTNKEIAGILMKRYSAKEVNFVEILDKKLLGGYKIEVNDEVIDLTIKNKLEKLQEHLTRKYE
jgi:F-type H+-transporting ATPase subunit delta